MFSLSLFSFSRSSRRPIRNLPVDSPARLDCFWCGVNAKVFGVLCGREELVPVFKDGLSGVAPHEDPYPKVMILRMFSVPKVDESVALSLGAFGDLRPVSEPLGFVEVTTKGGGIRGEISVGWIDGS